MNVLQELQNDAAGVALLKDWLGSDGAMVPMEQAESRSVACTHGHSGMKCPFNVAPGWWNLIEQAKNEIAQTIRAQLELKKHLSLRVENDDSMHMCHVCGCCMKLKVFTPIEHIKAHTTPVQMALYPSWCWIRKEIEK